MATYGKITIPLKAQKLFSCDLISTVGTDSLVGSMSTYGRPVFESKLKDLFLCVFPFVFTRIWPDVYMNSYPRSLKIILKYLILRKLVNLTIDRVASWVATSGS